MYVVHINSVSGEQPDGDYPLKLYHLCWVDKSTLLACGLNMMGSESVMYQLNLDKQANSLTTV